MKEEKNLDRLFQEKFKDFERHPSDAVWKRIAATQQDEKEDGKIIPFWWKLGGAAAVIALLFTTGVIVFNNFSNGATENPVVSTESNEKTTTENITIEDQQENDLTNSEDKVNTMLVQSNPTTSEATSNDEAPINSNKATTNNTTTNLEQTQIAQSTTGNTIVNNQEQSRNGYNTKNTQEASTAFAQNKVQEYNNKNDRFDKTRIDKSLENQRNANTAITQSTKENTPNTEVKSENEKLSLVEEAQRIEDDKEESEAVALLDEDKNSKRWDVGAVAAPVYYGDFGGSGLDPAFSDNTKSGDVNFSYGVQVSYAVSPKLKVRTGVSNVDLSYTTDGIAFTPNANARRIPGITYSENAQALNITDNTSNTLSDLASIRDGLIENTAIAQAVNGSLQQRPLKMHL